MKRPYVFPVIFYAIALVLAAINVSHLCWWKSFILLAQTSMPLSFLWLAKFCLPGELRLCLAVSMVEWCFSMFGGVVGIVSGIPDLAVGINAINCIAWSILFAAFSLIMARVKEMESSGK